jgi:CubicO group peptidase (beta-lactamase class C family)
VPNRASGYEIVKGALKNQEWVSPSLNTTADGSLYLSLLDMEKWDAALNTNRLLRRESIERMWSPAFLIDGKPAVCNPDGEAPVCYGFGWTIDNHCGYRRVAHGGAWQGFRCYSARFPELKLSIVVFANLAEADAPSIARAILEAYEPKLRKGHSKPDSQVP